MNNIQLATALVLDPKGAMREIEARPRFLFPLLVTMLVTVAVVVLYYSKVDIGWLVDATIRSNPRSANLTEEQMAAATRIMSKNTLLIGSLIAVPVAIVVIRLLESLWYFLAGKVTKVQRSYKQWFALSSWTGLPGVIALLPAIPLLLTTQQTQMDMATAISPLSLNALYFHRAMGEPGYNLYTNLNVVALFTVFLVVLGIKLWSGRSWLFALLYALLPMIVIGGIWALIALR